MNYGIYVSDECIGVVCSIEEAKRIAIGRANSNLSIRIECRAAPAPTKIYTYDYDEGEWHER